MVQFYKIMIYIYWNNFYQQPATRLVVVENIVICHGPCP